MQKYPIGQQDFKGIREGNFTYVDKTRYISMLIEGNKYYFLGRPRRFGKSLFLSTMKYFFLGERDLFKGLYIDNHDWNWEEYPVIHIDLNGADYTERKETLREKLDQQFRYVEEKYDLRESFENYAIRFEYLITELYKKTGRQVVVLVDEYEKPVLDAIDLKELSETYREFLRGFYGVLKSLDQYLKIVFLTGITRFGKMNIFSALNNINDISLDDQYGGICGITEEEMRSSLGEGIMNLAKSEGLSYDEAVEALKRNYDGYHFSIECPDIYNPFSLMSALSKGRISSFWASTGTPGILAKLLIRKRYDVKSLDGIKTTESKMMNMGGEFEDPVPLFYQTGYLTIKDYNRRTRRYTLGFPNQEVEVSFAECILPFYQKTQYSHKDSFTGDFIEGVLEGNPQLAMNALQAFSASINYELVDKPEIERHFQSMIYIFSRMMLPYVTEVNTEDRTSDGRIDLLIKTPEYIYLIEIKRDSSAEEALAQIESKDYSRQFATDPRKIFLIGMNFSTKTRRLEDYKIEDRV